MSRARPTLPPPSASKPEVAAASLRALAARAEVDAAFAAQVAAALWESGLLPTEALPPLPALPAATRAERHSRRSRIAPVLPGDPAVTDPFAILRDDGEEALTRALWELELPDLRAIVRSYRLDPARISARWTTRQRVIQLIVSQVRAHLDHGKAFSRV